jgi:hypothetical protein
MDWIFHCFGALECSLDSRLLVLSKRLLTCYQRTLKCLSFTYFSFPGLFTIFEMFWGTGDLGNWDIWFRFSCLELKINKEAFFCCVIRVCKNTFVSFGINFGCSTFTGTFIAKLFEHKACL